MADVEVLATIEASIQEGGWRASGTVINNADILDFYKQFRCWFDIYASGGWGLLPQPAFNGHLLPEPWTKTLQTSTAPMGAFTAQEFMKRGRIQGIWFTDQPYPANQHQITDMTLADIVSHIVGQAGEYGHCNLAIDSWPLEGIILTDIDSANSTEIDTYEVKEGGFWQRLQEIAQIDFYYIWFDKTNTFHFTPHPMFSVVPAVVFELNSQWLSEPLEIIGRNDESAGQVILSGTTPAGLQLYGRYPTNPTAGPILEQSGYLGTADTIMADIAERIYKFENRSHSVTAQIGNGVGLLLDLMDRVSITYASAPDGINWSQKAFWIHGITVDILPNFTARTTLKLESENA